MPDNSRQGKTLKYLDRIYIFSHSANRYSQTGWLHQSQQHLFLPTTSSESTALQLSFQRTAPASFAVEALGNPITMIRQMDKLIDTKISNNNHDFLLIHYINK